MFTNDSSVILISAPLRNQHNCKEIKMTIKPTSSNDLDMIPNHITFYNWELGLYDHYKVDRLTKPQIKELEDMYNLLDDDFNNQNEKLREAIKGWDDPALVQKNLMIAQNFDKWAVQHLDYYKEKV